MTKIHGLELADRRLKVRVIAETVYISKDRVGDIVHGNLGMRKLLVRWVPRLLTPDNDSNRETSSYQCLTLFKRNPKEFRRRFVTGTHQRPRYSRSSGLYPANVLRIRRRLSYRPERRWPPFSGIRKV